MRAIALAALVVLMPLQLWAMPIVEYPTGLFPRMCGGKHFYKKLTRRVVKLEEKAENLDWRVNTLEEEGTCGVGMNQFYLVDANNEVVGPAANPEAGRVDVWIEQYGVLVPFSRQGPYEYTGTVYFAESGCGGTPYTTYQNEMAFDKHLIINGKVWRFSSDNTEEIVVASKMRGGVCDDRALPAGFIKVTAGEEVFTLPGYATPLRIEYTDGLNMGPRS